MMDINHNLIKSIIDTIPLLVLFLDTILFKEFDYIKGLIVHLNNGKEVEKIREMCFCKHSMRNNDPNISKGFPYLIYPDYLINFFENRCKNSCPVFGNLPDHLHRGLIKSPKFSRNEIKIDTLPPTIQAYLDNITEDTDSTETYYEKLIFKIYNISNKIGLSFIYLRLKRKNNLIHIKNNLNKIVNSKKFIQECLELIPSNDDDLTALCKLYVNRLHPRDFKPEQLNRMLLEKGLGNSTNGYERINPFWRIVHDHGICRISLVQFFEATSIQCATFALLFYGSSNLNNTFDLFVILSAILFVLAIINEKIYKGQFADMFIYEVFGFPVRIFIIFILWFWAFSFSLKFIT